MRRLAHAAWLCLLLLLSGGLAAQGLEGRRAFSQAELDQMLAPVALYPDALLSQVLMAATYPREVFEAASWSRDNPDLRGDAAVRAVDNEDWHPSVVSLAAFPELLAMMDQRRDWTVRLGQAYLAQPGQVMDTVQALRARADAEGHLRSSEELVVQRQGSDYVIEPPTPEIVYVPYYDPRLVYGTWWWPAYQPVYWRPWAGYEWRRGYRGLCWGPRIVVGHGFFFGGVDWRHRHLRYSHQRPWYYRGEHFHPSHRWNHHARDRHGEGHGHRGRHRERPVHTGNHGMARDPRGFFHPPAPAAQPGPVAPVAPAAALAPAAPARGAAVPTRPLTPAVAPAPAPANDAGAPVSARPEAPAPRERGQGMHR